MDSGWTEDVGVSFCVDVCTCGQTIVSKVAMNILQKCNYLYIYTCADDQDTAVEMYLRHLGMDDMHPAVKRKNLATHPNHLVSENASIGSTMMDLPTHRDISKSIVERSHSLNAAAG